MNCPFCGAESRVAAAEDAISGTRRRRQCVACDRRFTTYEKLHIVAVMVLKEDGRLEPFSPQKLRRSIRRAAVKRDLPFEQVASDVEQRLYRLARDPLPSRDIGETVMAELKDRDWVAYIRYASIYRNFKEAGDFIDAAENLRRNGRLHPSQMAFIDELKRVGKNSTRNGPK